jgi:zinc D-Ala-D-Ala carboxypeptidase
VKLSEHFSLEELTRTDHRTLDNTPDPIALANLQRLAEFLERVREVLGGKPVMVNSAYRSKAVNDAVGSKDTSQHRLGLAADFRVPGMTPQEVVGAIVDSGIPYDQVIKEYDSWTHISIPNLPAEFRKMALIIDKAGTRTFA